MILWIFRVQIPASALKTHFLKEEKTMAETAAKKKVAFGGYTINFAGRKETAEQIFGNKAIAPSEMTKKIWAFVKGNKLSNKKA